MSVIARSRELIEGRRSNLKSPLPPFLKGDEGDFLYYYSVPAHIKPPVAVMCVAPFATALIVI